VEKERRRRRFVGVVEWRRDMGFVLVRRAAWICFSTGL
jgi:hypothetical protein